MQQKPLATIDDVWQALEQVNQLLETSQLQTLQNFNKAYAIITKNVLRKLHTDYFEDPKFLQTFDVHFVHYYFDALNSYLQGHHVPIAWKELFEGCEQQTLSPIKAMALGVNAHVNNDIAQVLLDCKARAHHKRDFNKVNRIIQDSVYEILRSLEPQQTAFSPQKRMLKPLYIIGMNVLIRVWRAGAWYSFTRLQKQRYDVQKVEHRAALVSYGTRRLPI